MSKKFDKIEQLFVKSQSKSFDQRMIAIGHGSLMRKKIIKGVLYNLKQQLTVNGKNILRSNWAKEIVNKIYKDLGGDDFAKIIGLRRHKLIGLKANEGRNPAPGLYFSVRDNPKFVETVGISITNKNLYDLSFTRIGESRFGGKIPIILSFENDVPRDMLQETIKKHTGLYTSL